MRVIRFIIVCTILGTTPFAVAQENNLIDHPQYRELVDRLHATFFKHNDHDIDTREPRTTKAFRIIR
jgi:hypothetical protein